MGNENGTLQFDSLFLFANVFRVTVFRVPVSGSVLELDWEILSGAETILCFEYSGAKIINGILSSSGSDNVIGEVVYFCLKHVDWVKLIYYIFAHELQLVANHYMKSWISYNIIIGQMNKICHSILKISERVTEAIAHHKPIVALESTIISHGMPYPQNK